LSALGFHPAAKSVRLRAATPVGLERALRHEMIYSSSVERIMHGAIHKYIRGGGRWLARDPSCQLQDPSAKQTMPSQLRICHSTAPGLRHNRLNT
jgi:hypothetical protein